LFTVDILNIYIKQEKAASKTSDVGSLGCRRDVDVDVDGDGDGDGDRGY
jgi:hypothetical protein